ncbi:MAG: ExbD/TolR family protein [Flavisolibacter sp.]
MTQIEMQPSQRGNRRRRLPSSLRIDMTPMVDLGFLLISFFIFTTTLSEKKATSLIMPADGPPMKLASRNALTILLGKENHVYAYEGLWNEAVKKNEIRSTNYDEYNGIGALIRKKQKELESIDKEGKNGLMLLIRPAKQSSYKT